MSRTLIAAPVLILAWLAAQLWVYLPTYSGVADAAFITKLMVEEIASWLAGSVPGPGSLGKNKVAQDLLNTPSLPPVPPS